uniref:Peptidylglycine alpha-amidating monooxygenase n=1 Tax=Cyprinus carpio TaxID=7962 RepID=A0A8C2K908_CYPCA
MDTAHHMILYGCQTPYATQGYWDCGKELGTCRDQAKIMYAWARNAPPTKLPKGALLSPHHPYHHRDFTNADIACTYPSSPMYPFAFRTHTHSLGKVVSGYRVRNGQWTQIGRQSPLLPQAFYPVTNTIDVRNGDILAARCVFTGEGRTTITQIGGTSSDEMCNFYIMYYMDNTHAVPYMNCGDDGSSELFRNIPSEANIPIPVTPDHMMSMKHESAPHKDVVELQEPKREEEVLDQGDLYSLLSKLLGEREDVVHMHKYNLAEAARAQKRLMAEIDSIMQKKDLGWPRLGYKTKEDAILVRDRVHKFHQLESTVSPSRSRTVPARQPTTGAAPRDQPGAHLVEVSDWPEAGLQLGQVSGLALKSNGDLIIFHRGDHIWGINSFNFNGVYQQKDLGPIQQSTIMVVDPVKGKVLKASGRNMFYMPHGITTDKDDNYWVTDVALHQVFKLSSDGKDRQLLVLGEAFEPGSDKKHFCQPTDVAVDPVTGNVYVSDGYCNSRILKISPEGKYISHWGAETETFVQANLKPLPKFPAQHPVAAVQKTQEPSQKQDQQPLAAPEEKQTTKTAANQSAQGVPTAIITTLLLVPLVLVIAIGVCIRWRRGRMYNDCQVKLEPSGSAGGILGKIRGKAAGSLNLGNFFASHKGYTRHGFDRLSTEGSDLEKDDEDGTDSENEEYSAPPAPMSSS